MAKIDAFATGLKAAHSFDQLVVGPNNSVAVGACQAVVKTPGETYNPLFIYGPSGVGKTHLIQATANEILVKNKQFKVRYMSAERFTSDVLMALSEDRILETRKNYSDLDLLIIDDVQYLAESKVAQEELFHVFNNLHHENKQVILAADRPPNQLGSLNKNIRSRLEWGLSTNVNVPDEPTRVLILKRKQEAQGLKLNEQMIAFVARALRSNVRELEGFLKRIHAYSTLSKQELNMELVQSVVKEILPAGLVIDVGGDIPSSAAPPPREEAPTQPNIDLVKPRKNGREKDSLEPPKTESPPTSEDVPFDLLLDSIQVTEPESTASAPPAKAAAKAPKVEPVIEEKISRKKYEEPPPPAVEAVEIPDAPPEESEDGNLPSGHKEVGAVIFYPEGANEALECVYRKFLEVIKKHKLKFRLKRVCDHAYAVKGKINYMSFVDVCKTNKVPVAIVIGPPPEAMIPQQDFYDLLTVTLDVQGVSLQLVNWAEVNKDYRYLNLALDIALVRLR